MFLVNDSWVFELDEQHVWCEESIDFLVVRVAVHDNYPFPLSAYIKIKLIFFSVDKKTQLDVPFCILYFSSNSCSTCFGQPCAHHQELTTA